MALLLFNAGIASAYDFITDGIYYNIVGNGQAAVTNNGDADTYTGVVVVPSTVKDPSGNTYSVVSIANAAFYGCDHLTEVDLPSSIILIDSWAFYGDTELKKCDLPKNLIVIRYRAFYGCSALEEVNIPASTTLVAEESFFQCGMSKLTFGPNVSYVGSGAFVQCNNITDVTLPDSLRFLGDDIFYECQRLRSVTLPEKLHRIGQSTFCRCYSLQEITIPDEVDSIGYGAFYYCSSLKKISFGKSVTEMGGYGTYGWCNNLKDIYSSNPIPPNNAVFQNDAQHDTYTSATLHLPSQEACDAYSRDANWSNFFPNNVVVDSQSGTDGIDGINATDDASAPTVIYDLNGREVRTNGSLPKGVYIVKQKGQKAKVTIKK